MAAEIEELTIALDIPVCSQWQILATPVFPLLWIFYTIALPMNLAFSKPVENSVDPIQIEDAAWYKLSFPEGGGRIESMESTGRDLRQYAYVGREVSEIMDAVSSKEKLMRDIALILDTRLRTWASNIPDVLTGLYFGGSQHGRLLFLAVPKEAGDACLERVDAAISEFLVAVRREVTGLRFTLCISTLDDPRIIAKVGA